MLWWIPNRKSQLHFT